MVIYGDRFLNSESIVQEQLFSSLYKGRVEPKKLKILQNTAVALNDIFKNNGLNNINITDAPISYSKITNDKFLYKDGNEFGYRATVKCNDSIEYFNIQKWTRNNTELIKDVVSKATKYDVSKIRINVDTNIGKYSNKKPIISYMIIYITYNI